MGLGLRGDEFQRDNAKGKEGSIVDRGKTCLLQLRCALWVGLEITREKVAGLQSDSFLFPCFCLFFFYSALKHRCRHSGFLSQATNYSGAFSQATRQVENCEKYISIWKFDLLVAASTTGSCTFTQVPEVFGQDV